MRLILLVGAFVFCTPVLIAQEQISNRMTISLEGSTTFDAEFTGGGLKIDRKINNNFSVGVFSSIYLTYLPQTFISSGSFGDGETTILEDNGDQVIYEYKRNPLDSTNNGDYLYAGYFGEEVGVIQIGLRVKYSLYSQKTTKPYVGFNVSYNKEFISPSKPATTIIDRLEENNGLLTSLELGLDQHLSNRFVFFINVRATLLTNLVQNDVKLNTISEEKTQDIAVNDGSGGTYVQPGFGINSAIYEETFKENRFPTFFGSIGISYKIY
jgi:hypothetical protein